MLYMIRPSDINLRRRELLESSIHEKRRISGERHSATGIVRQRNRYTPHDMRHSSMYIQSNRAVWRRCAPAAWGR